MINEDEEQLKKVKNSITQSDNTDFGLMNELAIMDKIKLKNKQIYEKKIEA